MNIAVTGASGYVGGAIAHALRAAGHTVTTLSRSSPKEGPHMLFTLGEAPATSTLDAFDGLVHCAYDFSARSWEEIARANVAGTRSLFSVAAQAGVRHLLFISSMSSFADSQSMYGKSKWLSEQDAHSLGVTIVRPGLVYGPNAGGMTGTLEKMVARLPVCPLIDGGRQTLHMTHDADLGALFVELFARSTSVSVPISAAHDRPVSLREIVSTIAERREKRVRFFSVPSAPMFWVLRSLEALGVRSKVRSDSLTSVLNQNPHPDFSGLVGLRTTFRPFSAAAF